jgi:hypothetical protein
MTEYVSNCVLSIVAALTKPAVDNAKTAAHNVDSLFIIFYSLFKLKIVFFPHGTVHFYGKTSHHNTWDNQGFADVKRHLPVALYASATRFSKGSISPIHIWKNQSYAQGHNSLLFTNFHLSRRC